MEKLLKKYEELQLRLQAIQDDFSAVEKKYSTYNDTEEEMRAARIEHYQEQLEKIEEYREKIDYYRKLAEQHMESKNLLATEGMDDIAGQPRELNFKHMHDWATFIDPTNPDDPYAQRIYVMAKCNLIYLDSKQKQFEERINELQSGKSVDADGRAAIQTAKLKALKESETILTGTEFTEFCAELKKRAAFYQDCQMTAERIKDVSAPGLTSCTAILRELPVFSEQKAAVKGLLGDCYDEGSNLIAIPAETDPGTEYVLSAAVSAGKEKKLYRSLQNYLYQRIAAAAPGTVRINVFDAIHYNNSSLGPLRVLDETSIIGAIPADEEKMIDGLQEVISDFIEIDEKLGMADNAAEFNAGKDIKDQIPRRIAVLIGYPSQFSSEAVSLINRIILNHEHYGVSVITVDTQFTQKKLMDDDNVTKTVSGNIIQMRVSDQNELISVDHGTEYSACLYELKDNLPEHFVRYIKDNELKENSLGNEYIKRVGINNDVLSSYTRGKKTINLPYGVDASDNVNSINFSNEKFATFLMGASGSGKSTLLHTLITGILKDYHPDDVELWLADFKMSEFAQYINPMPPHVKYILLDESPELVYDLINKLTEQMMERQRYFMIHRNIKKVEDVPSDVYMPVIFVILDEFSIMSQAIAESEEYKLKLQNLLAKGRALGIKFLFSSQTFSKGIQGLTPTAKEQIQSRIAMKNSKAEVEETLELSPYQKTEKIRNWIDAFPPHYALYKYREEDTIQVKRMKVLYFAGKGTEAYLPQRNLIESMNSSLVKVSSYNSENTKYYLDKNPVIVDGNSYTAFDSEKISTQLKQYREAHRDEYASDDTLIVAGSPRRMDNFIVSAFTAESRENMLMIARSSEQMQTAANLLTIMKCFQLQNRNVEIWAYGRDRLYRAFRNSHWNQYSVKDTVDDIAAAIHELKQIITDRVQGNTVYVLMGFERVLSDFEPVSYKSAAVSHYQTNPAAAVSSQQEIDLQKLAQGWTMKKSAVMKAMKQEGKSEEEINNALEKEKKAIFSRIPVSKKAETKPSEPQKKAEEKPVNPAEEFQELIRQGSRYGYHFIITASSLADFRQTGLKLDLFRHRISGQVSKDDSTELFGQRNAASELPEHVCVYDNGTERYSYRPYLHPGLNWDGWYVNEDTNEVVNVYANFE